MVKVNKIFSAFFAIFSCGPFQETIGLAKDINKTENKRKADPILLRASSKFWPCFAFYTNVWKDANWNTFSKLRDCQTDEQ